MPERDESEPTQESAAGAIWSGTITFGLVSVTVELFPASRRSRVSLRMLGPDGTPLARRYFSSDGGKPLRSEDIVRGYKAGNGDYVIVTDEELERLAPEKSRDIELKQFVPAGEIPPIYFQRAYFLAPSGKSTKAYRLLAAAMERTGRAGIATFVMRGKEYLVAILSENGILRAETLYFHDEIRSARDVGLPERQEPSSERMQRYQKSIRAASKDSLPLEELRDEASARLLQLAEKKWAKHQDVVEIEEPAEHRAEVIDIVTLLKQSLSSQPKKKAPGRARSLAEPTMELEGYSREELYERARALKIAGRSSMSKQQLIKAIRQAA